MRLEKNVTNCKFVYTKDECGYAEVIEKFKTSKQIYIMTFNISSKKDNLLESLGKLNENCEVFIITNIPQRYESYFSKSARGSARKKINVYMRRLDPKNFESKIIPYFNFKNHAKIIISDENAYIGSANYSDESNDNYESGFISYDKDFLSFLKKEVFKFTMENSEPYFDDLFVNFRIIALNLCSKLFTLNRIIDESFYEYIEVGHSGIDERIYNTDCFKAKISEDNLENLISVLYEVEELINEFEENYICNYEIQKEKILYILKNFDKKIINESIELIDIDSDIYNLCSFDYESEYNYFLEKENFGSVYNEKFGYICFGESPEEKASEKFAQLAQLAQDDIERLMINLEQILENIVSLLENISLQFEVNRNIDNTNI